MHLLQEAQAAVPEAELTDEERAKATMAQWVKTDTAPPAQEAEEAAADGEESEGEEEGDGEEHVDVEFGTEDEAEEGGEEAPEEGEDAVVRLCCLRCAPPPPPATPRTRTERASPAGR